MFKDVERLESAHVTLMHKKNLEHFVFNLNIGYLFEVDQNVVDHPSVGRVADVVRLQCRPDHCQGVFHIAPVHVELN